MQYNFEKKNTFYEIFNSYDMKEKTHFEAAIIKL